MGGTNQPGIDLKRFRAALRLLRQAYVYQADTGRSAWDFAVEISILKSKRLSRNDLRWLVCKGYVEHQREITPPGDDLRMFRATGAMTFSRRSCFILTEAGKKFVEECLARLVPLVEPPANGAAETLQKEKIALQPVSLQPRWDRDRHELWVQDRIVKRFKRPAANQETILATFEEDGWPSRIDDPLPMLAEQDPRRRLHDTIKCLNRNQKHHLIHFQGDGTGQGVLWEFTKEAGLFAP